MSTLSRRGFVAAGAAATIPAASSNSLPTRAFGKTGARVTILALGCGNRLWMAYPDQDRGVEAINLAIESGIRYMDTAQGYGDGMSETWVGIAAQGRRDRLFLATKTGARTADDLMRRAEQSLKRLRTDRLDVLHIHGLRDAADLNQIEAKGGALEALYRLRDQKMVRFIGITSHSDPHALADALGRHDFDCTQMALNAGLQGKSPDGAGFWKKPLPGKPAEFGEAIAPQPFPGTSFQDLALPVANRKKMGVIAMKVTAQEGLIGSSASKAAAGDLIRYALSLPVSVATVGMPQLEFIRKNTQLARAFQPMGKRDMKALSDRLSSANKTALDRHFARHEDA
ncbi:MAG: aldo/keto reductase [Acidobacteria bacterium]|nr:aldo/keto reductase [Acidobacteriota bacterium]